MKSNIYHNHRLDKVERISNVNYRHDKIRLDKSERTITFPDNIWKRFMDILTQEDFIAYPEVHSLAEKIAVYHGVKIDNVFLTAGSDIAIRSFFELFSNITKSLIIPTPSFPMYKVYSNIYGSSIVEVPYINDILDIESFIKHISNSGNIVIIDNPGNPLGNYTSLEELETLISECYKRNICILIDEAYMDFCEDGESAIDLIDKYNNLCICRTFSKSFGAAGVRVGYIISSNNIIQLLYKIRPMYEINQIGVKFISFLLDNIHIMEQYVDSIKSEKEELCISLLQKDFDVKDTNCNWIHFRSKNERIKKITKIFDKYNVLYKKCYLPNDNKEWIRLTIGPSITDTKYMREIMRI